MEATWRRWALGHRLDPAAVIAVAHGRRTIETVRLVAPDLDAVAEAAALASIAVTGTYPPHVPRAATYTISSLAGLSVAAASEGGPIELRLALA